MNTTQKLVKTDFYISLDISFYCIPDTDDLPQAVKDNVGSLLDAIAAD